MTRYANPFPRLVDPDDGTDLQDGGGPSGDEKVDAPLASC